MRTMNLQELINAKDKAYHKFKQKKKINELDN